ncbi:MAG: hypothetical protein AAF849_19010 [Bacteroidota bacterium]
MTSPFAYFLQQRKTSLNFICLLIFSFFLTQCQSDKGIPPASDIAIDVKIKRFEQELFALETQNSDLSFDAQVSELASKYPQFFEVFKELIADAYGLDTSVVQRVRKFIEYEGVRQLYDTTQVLYNDIAWIEEELETVFKRYKTYFPEKPIPEVVSFISEYGVGTFTYGDSLLAIGWDFFLGEDFHYDYNVFPAFLQKSMDQEHLVAKAVETLASNVMGEVYGNRLLDHMVANGKTLYLKSLLLPDTKEEVLLEWHPEQLEWMQNNYNERELWNQIVKRDLLYSTRRTEFDKLIVASPFGTTWMPRNSPGKAGNWIGWQIVKAYMKEHPETSVEELAAVEDAQVILDGSRYRPGR